MSTDFSVGDTWVPTDTIAVLASLVGAALIMLKNTAIIIKYWLGTCLRRGSSDLKVMLNVLLPPVTQTVTFIKVVGHSCS